MSLDTRHALGQTFAYGKGVDRDERLERPNAKRTEISIATTDPNAKPVGACLVPRITTIVVTKSMKTKELQLKDAKATLSAVVNNAVRGQPYVITRHGRPEAVGYREWKRLSRVPCFGRLLTAPPVTKGYLPQRNRGPLRERKF